MHLVDLIIDHELKLTLNYESELFTFMGVHTVRATARL